GITTNNQAEYQALKFGLERAHKLGVQVIYVYMDSMLVVNQMKGIFKIKNRDLWPIHAAIIKLAKTFKKITYTHVPRELNQLADSQVNKCLDAEAKADSNDTRV
ncbi:MAG: ribonuclease HI family protein, partial [Candidatus Saccharimonadales bacterium]